MARLHLTRSPRCRSPSTQQRAGRVLAVPFVQAPTRTRGFGSAAPGAASLSPGTCPEHSRTWSPGFCQEVEVTLQLWHTKASWAFHVKTTWMRFFARVEEDS